MAQTKYTNLTAIIHDSLTIITGMHKIMTARHKSTVETN